MPVSARTRSQDSKSSSSDQPGSDFPTNHRPRMFIAAASKRIVMSDDDDDDDDDTHRAISKVRVGEKPKRTDDADGWRAKSASKHTKVNNSDDGKDARESHRRSPDPPRKKTKTKCSTLADDDVKHFWDVGRYITRVVCLNPALPVVFRVGQALRGSVKVEKDKYKKELTKEERVEYLRIYDAILEYSPRLATLCQNKDGASINEALKLMEGTMSAARSADTSSIKRELNLYAPFDHTQKPLEPSVGPNDKSAFGFNHKQLGRLLCPVNMVDEYDLDPDRVLSEIKSGKRNASAAKLPAFMYATREDGSLVRNPTIPSQGMFEGQQFLRVFRHIWLGSSAAFDGKLTSAKSIAKSYNIYTVTPHMAAYVFVQTYYTMSSCSWSASMTDDQMDLRKLYRKIVKILTDDKQKRWCEDILAKLTNAVFGRVSSSSSKSTSSDVDDEEDDFDDIHGLGAQRAPLVLTPPQGRPQVQPRLIAYAAHEDSPEFESEATPAPMRIRSQRSLSALSQLSDPGVPIAGAKEVPAAPIARAAVRPQARTRGREDYVAASKMHKTRAIPLDDFDALEQAEIDDDPDAAEEEDAISACLSTEKRIVTGSANEIPTAGQLQKRKRAKGPTAGNKRYKASAVLPDEFTAAEQAELDDDPEAGEQEELSNVPELKKIVIKPRKKTARKK